MYELIPAFLEKTEGELKDKISQLPNSQTFLHLDVLEEDIWTEFPQDFEAHLMLEHPEAVVKTWIERGAKRVIVHKITDDILKYRGQVEIGLGVELDVPIEDVLILAELADFVHIMSIAEIGEQGHPLDPRVFDRIKVLQERFPGMVISVDGGITGENYLKLVTAGADRLVVGSHFNEIWQSLQTIK